MISIEYISVQNTWLVQVTLVYIHRYQRRHQYERTRPNTLYYSLGWLEKLEGIRVILGHTVLQTAALGFRICLYANCIGGLRLLHFTSNDTIISDDKDGLTLCYFSLENKLNSVSKRFI